MLLHEALEPLSWLAGRWVTETGRGIYPTIKEFSYKEVLEFTCVGQPMFNYLATSTHPVKQTPMHQERGFLRVHPGTNNISFMVSHNFGLTTLEEGSFSIENKEIMLKSISVSRMSFAKEPFAKVQSLQRTIRLVAPDKLEVVLLMETDRTQLTEHLRAVYEKEAS